MQKRRGLLRLFHIRPLLYPATFEPGAGDGVRTRDPELGKLVLYQLSYTRNKPNLALPTPAGKNNLYQGKIWPINDRISAPPKLLRFGGFASI